MTGWPQRTLSAAGPVGRSARYLQHVRAVSLLLAAWVRRLGLAVRHLDPAAILRSQDPRTQRLGSRHGDVPEDDVGRAETVVVPCPPRRDQHLGFGLVDLQPRRGAAREAAGQDLQRAVLKEPCPGDLNPTPLTELR